MKHLFFSLGFIFILLFATPLHSQEFMKVGLPGKDGVTAKNEIKEGDSDVLKMVKITDQLLNIMEQEPSAESYEMMMNTSKKMASLNMEGISEEEISKVAAEFDSKYADEKAMEEKMKSLQGKWDKWVEEHQDEAMAIVLAQMAAGEDLTETTGLKEKNEDEIFQVVDKEPEFPGGSEALTRYLKDNIKYPQKARESNISGRVYVTFIVEKDGSVSNVRVLRDIGGGCGQEVARVVKSMPQWSPGHHKGKNVRVKYNLPVNF